MTPLRGSFASAPRKLLERSRASLEAEAELGAGAGEGDVGLAVLLAL